jgi:DNA-binding transcriptional regulator YhcF (GntR family)
MDPRYLQIVGEILRRIETGQLRPGDRVPSTRQIAREWQVAMATATKVLTTLGQQGVVEALPGIGTVVSSPTTRRAPRKGELSTDAIVTIAIAMADAEGLTALSMRRVATAMDVGVMTLYHYVPSKDELVRLMAEAVFGVEPLPDPGPDGWRARMETVARLHWRTYQRHPWVAAPALTSITRPPVLPSGIAQVEWQLAGLAAVGLDGPSMLRAVVSLSGYVGGVALSHAMAIEQARVSETSYEERHAAYNALAAEVFAAGDYPTLVGLDVNDAEIGDLDALFEFGLQRHLDGIAVLISRM